MGIKRLGLFFILPLCSAIAGEIRPTVIYGEDNRLDWYDVNDQQLRKIAESTVGLFDASTLQADGPNQSKIVASTLGQRRNLCSTERFKEQITGAYCSGSLVAPDMILTAGHCITGPSDCNSTKFVFGYAMAQASDDPSVVQNSNIYGCKRIVRRMQVGTGADYAVIELDRLVLDHEPLKVRLTGRPSVGDEIVVIGHPSGLPSKVAGGAQIRAFVGNSHFEANLDTYGGNSGSGVFNSKTLELEGILVRGETDYVRRGSCYVSNVCTETGCRGEDVTLVSNALPFF